VSGSSRTRMRYLSHSACQRFQICASGYTLIRPENVLTAHRLRTLRLRATALKYFLSLCVAGGVGEARIGTSWRKIRAAGEYRERLCSLALFPFQRNAPSNYTFRIALAIRSSLFYSSFPPLVSETKNKPALTKSN